ncbi:unnamed protein product, partial [Mesorhabditis spiculigera]
MEDIETHLASFRLAVKEAGDSVRQLKADKAPKIDVDRAVTILKARKKELEEAEIRLAPKEIDRGKLETLLKQRFFYDQSFQIYGGVTGLYDFGPMGCALKQNMLNEWRKHFILEEGMLEVDCTSLTPEVVLKASGHVDRFADWMVKDLKTGDPHRCDHLIKNAAEAMIASKKTPEPVKEELREILARLDGFDNNDMQAVLVKYNMKSPAGNDLTEPIAFNLMFPTQIGPTGDQRAFLRPETAQGIFVNFKRLLEFNMGRVPFAAAQIGNGFRNEISPRQGLIRVREFTMCEIEHFVDPTDKSCAKFAKVRNYVLTLFTANDQMNGSAPIQIPIGEAVDKKIVDNETLGYYMARCHMYLLKVGVDSKRLRFRQHMDNEMAHYAQDCWDAEIKTSYGWIECVGNADRACYDLKQHSLCAKTELVAQKDLPEPKFIDTCEAVTNMPIIGKTHRKNAQKIHEHLSKLSFEQAVAHSKELEANGKLTITVDGESFELSKEMLSFSREEKKICIEEFTPSVIEPSYGIGRIMYAVLEHAFRQREGDEQRQFLALPPIVAPIKCSILPISAQTQLVEIIEAVKDNLRAHELSFRVDDSAGSIGRRYARTDEIGIPFGVTVDFESEKLPWTVTLRHAESLRQIRLKVEEVGETVEALVRGRLSWEQAEDQSTFLEVQKAYPTITRERIGRAICQLRRDFGKWFTTRHGGNLLDQLAGVVDDQLSNSDGDAVHLGSGMPSVLVHGDLWTNNLLWALNGQRGDTDQLLAIIDWQNVHAGNVAEDFVRLLGSSCSPRLRRGGLHRFVSHYLSCLSLEMRRKGHFALPYTHQQIVAAYEKMFGQGFRLEN